MKKVLKNWKRIGISHKICQNFEILPQIVKNRLYQQSFLNWDSFLNRAFLNWDSTVIKKWVWGVVLGCALQAIFTNQSFAVILNLDTIFMTLTPIFLKKLQLVLRPLFKMPLGAHSTQLSDQMDCSCAFHFDQYFIKKNQRNLLIHSTYASILEKLNAISH